MGRRLREWSACGSVTQIWDLSSHPFHPSTHFQKKKQEWRVCVCNTIWAECGEKGILKLIEMNSSFNLKIIQLESHPEKTTQIDLWCLHTGRCTKVYTYPTPMYTRRLTSIYITHSTTEGEGGRRRVNLLEISVELCWETSTLCLCGLSKKAVNNMNGLTITSF